MATTQKNRLFYSGFTIIELLIVIVIIGILATITFIAYSGIQRSATDSSAKDTLSKAVNAMKLTGVQTGSFDTLFPTGLKVAGGIGIALTEVADSSTFCINVTSEKYDDILWHADESGTITEGLCDGDVIEDSVRGDYNVAAQTPVSAIGVAHGDLYNFMISTNETWSNFTLSWSAIDGTVKYQIQSRNSSTDTWVYRTSSDGSGSYPPGQSQNDTNTSRTGNIANTVTSLVWLNSYPAQTLTTGNTFEYRLRSVGSGGVISDWSVALLSAPNNTTTSVPSVNTFTVTPDAGWANLTLSWDTPNKTGVVPLPIYQIQTRTSPTGTWVYRKTTNGNGSYVPGASQNDTNTTLTSNIPISTNSLNWPNSYPNTTLSTGGTHEYRIRVNSSKYQNTYSDWNTFSLSR
ncbi:MAG TPA: prepilin-type N-terminal cleavage/methylation domain-containing protein [Candidatus Saccharibacteria bacterium]|nr:prepilin-type N-terminal cleavage/methylation domain-containing protein [Candidatus Saccharibacteria bacterium]HRQ98021.1 prepilin-type N-terminal cleavage/methylation domain-containing protein [Candidatus Saccharibacteria bacterium]